MPPEDGELIEKIARNDQDAFDQLFYKYKSSVYRFAYYLTQNRSEADDLFQETWLRVVKSMNETIRLKNFKAWTFTIATNIHRDELRRKKIRRLFFMTKRFENDMYEDSQEDSNLAAAPNRNDVSTNVEFSIAFQKAIAKLPGKQRRVFILQEMEGFKQKEISQILSIPIGTVKSLFFRAIKFLQKELIEFQTN